MAAITASERLGRRIDGAVGRFMAENGLWPATGGLVVAVSGGPDSTALLLILSRLAQRRGGPLTAAYFDHGIRDDEARSAEVEVVRRLAEGLGLPLIEGAGDVPAVARSRRLSLEDAARQERYAFLAEAAIHAGARAVATGHTASDQVETVLMHLLRGAGLRGAGGMAPRSPWPVRGHAAMSLLRPLLCLSREETLAYCEAAGVVPAEDATNRSTAFLRNRVRHELLPLLRTYNAGVDGALLRLAGAAGVDEAYLDGVAAEAVRLLPDGSAALPRALLAGWQVSLRRHAVRLALEGVAGDLQGFSERHVLAVERLVISGRTGDRLDLPRGVRAELGRDDLVLATAVTQEAFLLLEGVVLAVPGVVRAGGIEAGASFEEAPSGATSVVVDAEAIGGALCVRRRRPGDRMQPLGMTETKKLQDILVDAHVPRGERDAVPVFEASGGIAWLGGERVAEWARLRPGRPALHLWYRAVAD